MKVVFLQFQDGMLVILNVHPNIQNSIWPPYSYSPLGSITLWGILLIPRHSYLYVQEDMHLQGERVKTVVRVIGLNFYLVIGGREPFREVSYFDPLANSHPWVCFMGFGISTLWLDWHLPLKSGFQKPSGWSSEQALRPCHNQKFWHQIAVQLLNIWAHTRWLMVMI